MHMFFVLLASILAVEASSYIAVSGFGLTQCTLLSSISLATLLQSRIGSEQSKGLEAGATDHVAMHTR